MPGAIERHLDLLDAQREAIFVRLGTLSNRVLWFRPGRRVWSIGEHLDHTRVLNGFALRLMRIYYPPATVMAWWFRRRTYATDIDDVYKRPSVPMNVGWLWPPRYTPRRPVPIAVLYARIRAEHDAYRHFFTTHDPSLLGHVVLVDPVIGALNLVQWLRVQGYHDAHHFERIRVRLDDPSYVARAVAEGAATTEDSSRGSREQA